MARAVSCNNIKWMQVLVSQSNSVCLGAQCPVECEHINNTLWDCTLHVSQSITETYKKESDDSSGGGGGGPMAAVHRGGGRCGAIMCYAFVGHSVAHPVDVIHWPRSLNGWHCVAHASRKTVRDTEARHNS